MSACSPSSISLVLVCVHGILCYLLHVDACCQWHTQDFRMGGVEVLQALRGWVWGGSIPLLTGEGSERGLKIFRIFFVENTIL